MNIRPLQPSDLEPLHRLYTSLVAFLPHHPVVSLDQFVSDLTSITWDHQPDAFLPAGEVAWVAEKAGVPVAFALASFLHQDGEMTDMKAGAGVLHFFFAAPEYGAECRALLRAIIEHSKGLGHKHFRALPEYYGPRFHNYGGARLSSAWPWLGQWLIREGFQTYGGPSLSLYRPLVTAPEPLPLPADAELRYDWVTRIGVRDAWEGGFHIFVEDERAAEVMYYYGEKFVKRAGTKSVYIFWLGTNPPFRGRGFGRLLLRQALITAYAAGAREACLRTGPNNFDALNIYRAEGFVPDDVLWEFQHTG